MSNIMVVQKLARLTTTTKAIAISMLSLPEMHGIGILKIIERLSAYSYFVNIISLITTVPSVLTTVYS